MMISIGTTRHIDYLKIRIKKGSKIFAGNSLKIKIKERPAGDFTFLFCRVAQVKNNYSEADRQILFRRFLADVISDLILNCWEEALLQEIIHENYYYFSDEEKKNIIERAIQDINRKEEGYTQSSLYQPGRKKRVLQKILDFLRDNNQFVIDGFIKFRLKDYLNELRDAVDKAVDDFLIDREYKEFIKLLKYFVEIQEPRADLVHVLIKSGGGFKLLDGRMKIIRSDYLESFLINLIDQEISCEDLLLSALISIAPKKIIAHFRCDDHVLETIKSIFASRVDKCPGCSLCSP